MVGLFQNCNALVFDISFQSYQVYVYSGGNGNCFVCVGYNFKYGSSVAYSRLLSFMVQVYFMCIYIYIIQVGIKKTNKNGYGIPIAPFCNNIYQN